jgi:ubiquinone/menaquinone biosynthesis C-methylase UbiE
MAKMVGETGKVIDADAQDEMLQVLRKKRPWMGLNQG